MMAVRRPGFDELVLRSYGNGYIPNTSKIILFCLSFAHEVDCSHQTRRNTSMD